MSDGGAVKATKKQVKGLLRNQRRARIDSDLPEIPNASKVIEKLEKRIEALEKAVASHEVTIQKLWKFKMERERKEPG